nr:DNA methyltransferase [Candidatus Freyarchaeota archaeon]
MKNTATQLDRDRKCPKCKATVDENLGEHIKKAHSEEEFKKAVLKAKKSGMPDPEIGELYGINFKQLEKIITEAYGINISALKKPKKIKYWEPKNYREETTTVWSFKQRGNWATHDGRYRGNWSPYIPRNVILKYTKLGDTVLDYFVGGGTTAVEAKLLGRKCIARDINPAAIDLTKENLNFDPQKTLLENYRIYEPEVSVGDARDLSNIPNENIDLICAHPPYAGIINYSSKVEGDLSKFSIEDFLLEIGKVAHESYRVLKPGGKCAILIGDTRKHKQVVPIGFRSIKVFLDAGFVLKELVIKRQHNCKTTGFWYNNSIKYNFLLLAHEYLPIFEKPEQKNIAKDYSSESDTFHYETNARKIDEAKKENLETTTVWILPQEKMDEEIKRNLIGRFVTSESQYLEINFNDADGKLDIKTKFKPSLVYVSSPKKLGSQKDINSYLKTIKKIAEEVGRFLATEGFLVIDTSDVRINGLVYPMGVNLLETMSTLNEFNIKEIVVVTPDNIENSIKTPMSNQNLEIIHRYLLIFVLRKGDG